MSANPPRSALTESRTAANTTSTTLTTWDEDVVNELIALPYVRAVVFTDGKGRTLRSNRRTTTPDDLARVADLALAAISRMGAALQLGRSEVNACVYQDGVLILSGSGKLQVAVLATAAANLGTLLNHTRRIFRQEQTP